MDRVCPIGIADFSPDRSMSSLGGSDAWSARFPCDHRPRGLRMDDTSLREGPRRRCRPEQRDLPLPDGPRKAASYYASRRASKRRMAGIFTRRSAPCLRVVSAAGTNDNCHIQVLDLDSTFDPLGSPRRVTPAPFFTIQGLAWTRDGTSHLCRQARCVGQPVASPSRRHA